MASATLPPAVPPREALLFEQHLDLTSAHSRLMTPFSAPSQLLISPLFSSPLLTSSFREKKPALPPHNTHPLAPSTPLLSSLPCPFFTRIAPLYLHLLAKESSHVFAS